MHELRFRLGASPDYAVGAHGASNFPATSNWNLWGPSFIFIFILLCFFRLVVTIIVITATTVCAKNV